MCPRTRINLSTASLTEELNYGLKGSAWMTRIESSVCWQASLGSIRTLCGKEGKERVCIVEYAVLGGSSFGGIIARFIRSFHSSKCNCEDGAAE